MPVIYQCDRSLWKPGQGCHSIATSLVATNPEGKKWLVPAPLWKLIDLGNTVALLCPTCGEQFDQEDKAAKAKLPKVGAATAEGEKLGITLLDGGRGLRPANEEADDD